MGSLRRAVRQGPLAEARPRPPRTAAARRRGAGRWSQCSRPRASRCVAMRTVRPCAAEPSRRPSTSRKPGGSRSTVGLVEQHDLGVLEQDPGEGEPLAHSRGEPRDGIVGALLPGRPRPSRSERSGRGVPAAEEPGPQGQVLEGGERLVEEGAVAQERGPPPHLVGFRSRVEAQQAQLRPGPAGAAVDSTRSSVDLPEPFRPASITQAPGGASNDTSTSAKRRPYRR